MSLELVQVAILVYGGSLVIDANLTIGTLVAFTQLRMLLAQPVRQVGNMLSSTARTTAAAERVFELLDTASAVTDKPDALELRDVQGHVRYDGVSFGYGKDLPVVQGIDIEVRPGETVALLGPVGGGKSTVLDVNHVEAVARNTKDFIQSFLEECVNHGGVIANPRQVQLCELGRAWGCLDRDKPLARPRRCEIAARDASTGAEFKNGLCLDRVGTQIEESSPALRHA